MVPVSRWETFIVPNHPRVIDAKLYGSEAEQLQTRIRNAEQAYRVDSLAFLERIANAVENIQQLLEDWDKREL